MKNPTTNLLLIFSLLVITGCTGRQNPGHYKPGTGDSWTGNPPKTNTSAPIPASPLSMSEKMAAARARSFVVAPATHTNGMVQLECSLPPDAAAVTLVAMVGTSPGVFKEWMRFGMYDNWTLRGLDETVTNYTYVMAATAFGTNSLPSNVVAFMPRTNLIGRTANVSSYSMRLMWTNTSATAIERTTKLPPAWTSVSRVTNTGPVSLIVTNPGSVALYRANSSALPRPLLSIQEWQKLIGWQSGTLRRLVDAASGSWTNIASGGGSIVSPVGETYRVIP